MVMPLPVPAVDCVQLIRDVVAERAGGVNAAFFAGIAAEWCQRVQQYIDAAGAPPAVTRWDAVAHRKTSFLNLYAAPSEDSAHGRVLRVMRRHDLSVCPACGELGRPNTLDHYLPKDHYPHLCITPVNLFPMCDACQMAKGTKVGDAASPRFFIHPYFDTFVAEQVLHLTIDPPFDAPGFALQIVDGLEAGHEELVRRHVRELEIERRYAGYFKNQHRRLLRLVGAMRNSGQDVLQTLSAFTESATVPSVNAWDYVFYAAVIGNGELIDYLENQDLPGYL